MWQELQAEAENIYFYLPGISVVAITPALYNLARLPINARRSSQKFCFRFGESQSMGWKPGAFWVGFVVSSAIFNIRSIQYDFYGSRCVQHQSSSFPVEESPKTTATSSYFKYGSKLKFFFAVGLEGSGHHLMYSIATNSPDVYQLRRWRMMPQLREIQRSLYQRDKPAESLWNVHRSALPNSTNVTQTQQHLVASFMEIERVATTLAENSTGSRKAVHIPLNTFKTLPEYGMASYPNFQDDCRVMSIPSLDLLYQSCDQARVDCGHVYIFRDPTDILVSTSIKRHFNKNLIEAMQMYISHLNIISTEMSAYSDHTWGCYGLFESGSSPPTWYSGVSSLYGWKNFTAFKRVMEEIYQAPMPSDKNEISRNLEPLRLSLQRAHERAIRICQEAVELHGPVQDHRRLWNENNNH